MAAMTKVQKVFVVELLAQFEEPSAVVAAVHETFGVQVSRQQVYNLDPTKAANDDRISEELRTLHAEVRARFLKEIEDIPIANKAYRLRLLQKQVEKSPGNAKLVRQACEQAAKEVGGVFTNKHTLEGGERAFEIVIRRE